jgi:hypothetical protein
MSVSSSREKLSKALIIRDAESWPLKTESGMKFLCWRRCTQSEERTPERTANTVNVKAEHAASTLVVLYVSLNTFVG